MGWVGIKIYHEFRKYPMIHRCWGRQIYWRKTHSEFVNWIETSTYSKVQKYCDPCFQIRSVKPIVSPKIPYLLQVPYMSTSVKSITGTKNVMMIPRSIYVVSKRCVTMKFILKVNNILWVEELPGDSYMSAVPEVLQPLSSPEQVWKTYHKFKITQRSIHVLIPKVSRLLSTS